MLILGLFKFLLPSGTESKWKEIILLIGALSVWKHRGTAGKSVRTVIDVVLACEGAGFHSDRSCPGWHKNLTVPSCMK